MADSFQSARIARVGLAQPKRTKGLTRSRGVFLQNFERQPNIQMSRRANRVVPSCRRGARLNWRVGWKKNEREVPSAPPREIEAGASPSNEQAPKSYERALRANNGDTAVYCPGRRPSWSRSA